jgi:hypothetical protein
MHCVSIMISNESREVYLCMVLKLGPFAKYIINTWCWRRMEKISWTDRVKNEALERVQGGKEHAT